MQRYNRYIRHLRQIWCDHLDACDKSSQKTREIRSTPENMCDRSLTSRLVVLLLSLLVVPVVAVGQGVRPFIKPEQSRVEYRDPAMMPRYSPVMPSGSPPTVFDLRDVEGNDDLRKLIPDSYVAPHPFGPGTDVTADPSDATQQAPRREDWLLSLDEAIRIALEHSEVVRVLAGNLAVSSGRTIYDPAIANTQIDAQRAAFDPVLGVDNTWNHVEREAGLDLLQSRITGVRTNDYNLGLRLSQRNMSGGTAQLRFNTNPSQTSRPSGFLDPVNRFSTELSYTQPLLRGAGVEANRVPIVLARLDAERSFFQFRDGIQELVRGVVEAYWSLVAARTDVWARRIQVQQSREAYERAEARQRADLTDISEVAQTRSALAQFRASLVAAESNLLQREAALLNILALPPTLDVRPVPTTPPTREFIQFFWDEILRLAEERRPDIVELKLVLEADAQRLLRSRNQARPQLDAVALYRWNGVEGRMPNGRQTSTRGGELTDWTLGVNFSVPLFLREERAGLRSAELMIARDRAALQQGIHAVQHRLALSVRNLAQFHAQYQANREAREAAKINMERQFWAQESGQIIFLNVLEAISTWGNSVSQEAQSLAQYNTELVNIERESGTILETHGIWLYEDRFCSLGPLWLRHREKDYPRNIRPGPNAEKYPTGEEPAEQTFDLDDYPRRRPRTDDPVVPPPPPPPIPLPGFDPGQDMSNIAPYGVQPVSRASSIRHSGYETHAGHEHTVQKRASAGFQTIYPLADPANLFD